MEELKNPQGEKTISTFSGLTIIVLVVVILGLIIWGRKEKAEAPTATVQIVKQAAEPVKENTPETKKEEPAAQKSAPVDFDQEIKDMDEAADSAGSTDFNDSDLSNTNLGI